MRISDWSSDVCSSDLNLPPNRRQARSHVRFCTDLCAEGTSRLAKGKDGGMTANSFDARSVLSAGGRDHEIYRLDVLGDDAAALPYSLKVLLENLLRKQDGDTGTDRKSPRLNFSH